VPHERRKVRSPAVNFDKPFFTTGDLARLCGVSQQTAIRWAKKGLVDTVGASPSAKRRHFRIRREDLVRFLKQHRYPTPAQLRPRQRILVVDDDPVIAEMLVDVFEREGEFEVQSAATAFGAGLAAREFQPDLILLDYLLPDINGAAVIRTIREDKSLRDVRIVLFSGGVRPDEVEDLLRCGADEFLQKPLNIARLVERVRAMLDTRGEAPAAPRKAP